MSSHLITFDPLRYLFLSLSPSLSLALSLCVLRSRNLRILTYLHDFICTIQLLIGDSEVIGDSGYGPALTKILQIAVPGASPVDSLATAYVSAEYPYYYWLPCTVTRSNGDVSKMSDAITQYVKSEKMRANLTSAKLNVYNSGIVRISTKPLEKKEGVPSGAPTPFKSYILVGIDLVSGPIELRLIRSILFS